MPNYQWCIYLKKYRIFAFKFRNFFLGPFIIYLFFDDRFLAGHNRVLDWMKFQSIIDYNYNRWLFHTTSGPCLLQISTRSRWCTPTGRAGSSTTPPSSTCSSARTRSGGSSRSAPASRSASSSSTTSTTPTQVCRPVVSPWTSLAPQRRALVLWHANVRY